MKENSYKIGLWGQFGEKDSNADGQAVRTNLIYNYLELKDGYNNLNKVSTYNWKQNKFSLLFNTIKLFFKNDKIVILPANNGLKVIVKLLNTLNVFKKKDLYYIVIGGFLPDFLNHNKKYMKKIKRYKGVFVQTKGLKDELVSMGLNNVHILSNFKNIKPTKNPYNYDDVQEIKFCTLSRVTETKGIIDAIKAVEQLNLKYNKHTKLDIYGVVDENFKNEFEKLLNHYKKYVDYKGVVKNDQTVEVLNKYYGLLFPTYFDGEGFPGNLIDAFNSGTPIIATDWMFNREIIKEGFNGKLVPINNSNKLAEAMLQLIKDKELAKEISKNNLEESKKYSADLVMKEFIDILKI